MTIYTQYWATIWTELWALGISETTWGEWRNPVPYKKNSQYFFNHGESVKELFISGDQNRSHQPAKMDTWKNDSKIFRNLCFICLLFIVSTEFLPNEFLLPGCYQCCFYFTHLGNVKSSGSYALKFCAGKYMSFLSAFLRMVQNVACYVIRGGSRQL